MTSPPSPSNPFLTSPSHSAFVSLGTHSLFLRASGPPRTPSQPVLVIECGLGGTSSEWVAVTRLLPFIRTFSYDRSGYSHSPFPPNYKTPPLTSKHRCEELTALLHTAGVEPPWILCGHSYGGTLVREFLLMHRGKGNVVGMVIVDSAASRTVLPDGWASLLEGRGYEDVVGLRTNTVLSEAEWESMKRDADAEGSGAVVAMEDEEQFSCTEEVNRRIREVGKERKLLEGRLSVVFCDESVDIGKVYEHGVREGNGSAEAREALRRRLLDMSQVDERGQRAHLVMCEEGMGRFVRAEGNARTHNVQLVCPKLIVGEVKWVLKGFERDRGRK